MKAGLCYFFIVTAASSLHALDIPLTRLETEFSIKPEFNRAFHYCADVSLSGALELKNLLTLGGGFSLGMLAWTARNGVSTYNAFGKAGLRFPTRFPLELSLSYIYNGIPDYQTSMHTLLPLVTCQWKWAGFSLGTTLRYTVYNQDVPLFEPILTFLIFTNVIDTRNLRVGFKIANFSDFLAGNMGAYFLNLNTFISLGRHLGLINELELYQTGSIALAATFYGIAYRGGIKWQW